MKLDMHCHTKEGSPDASVPIGEYIQLLKEQGFDGMLVTDHDSYKGYRYYEKHKDEMPRDFLVLKGIEYDTFDAGHIIVIMPKDVHLKILSHRGLPLRRLIRIVHQYGGILGPAHPCGERFLSTFSTGIYKWDRHVMRKFDFLEGYNAAEEDEVNEEAVKIAEAYEKPMTGGSDAHKSRAIGLAYTILQEEIKDEDDLIAYLKAKKPTECGGSHYGGTLKEKMGIFGKVLTYSFFPYNKAGALINVRKRHTDLTHMQRELERSFNEEKRTLERNFGKYKLEREKKFQKMKDELEEMKQKRREEEDEKLRTLKEEFDADIKKHREAVEKNIEKKRKELETVFSRK